MKTVKDLNTSIRRINFLLGSCIESDKAYIRQIPLLPSREGLLRLSIKSPAQMISMPTSMNNTSRYFKQICSLKEQPH